MSSVQSVYLTCRYRNQTVFYVQAPLDSAVYGVGPVENNLRKKRGKKMSLSHDTESLSFSITKRIQQVDFLIVSLYFFLWV